MQTNERLVRYSAEELREKRARGETMTNWSHVDALTEEELEASIDYDDEGYFDPDNGVVKPEHHRPESIGIDEDIHAWFKSRGGDVEGIMNAVLRRWMVARLPEKTDGVADVSAVTPARKGEAA